MTALLAGVDVGTTNCKVGLYTLAGEPVAEWRRATSRDADELVAGVMRGLAECVAAAGVDPVAVGVTGVAEGGTALDRDLRPMAPLTWWRDTRAEEEAAWLAREVGRDELFRRTGVDVAAKTPLANWLWLRRHEPALLDRMRVWVGIPELVATALCGTPISHRTFAGRSGAFDQRLCRYDGDLLGLAGLTDDRLPTLRTGSAGAGPLVVGTPVVVAGHDHLVAAHAAGAREHGDVVDSLGTTEAVVTVSERVAPDAAAGTGTSWNRTADGERWALVSAYPQCDQLLAWSRSLAGGLAELESVAESVKRPTGVVVLPYFGSRGAPAPDPDARFTAYDLTPGRPWPDVLVAGLEGACYHARWLAEHQAELAGTELGGVTVLGGPSRGRAWMSVKAQVMPGPVRVTSTADAACAGAALLAGAAVGLRTSALRSETQPRDDVLADRYDVIYRERFLPRVREVA